MKTTILILAITASLSGASALAYESRYDNQRAAYSGDRHDSFERHVQHLNRMLERVRWQLSRYHANWRVRRDVQDISREVDRVNWKFRKGNYGGRNLRGEVERLHDRLHNVEERLQVRSRDFYRWD
jgi:hypothetical protein